MGGKKKKALHSEALQMNLMTGNQCFDVPYCGIFLRALFVSVVCSNGHKFCGIKTKQLEEANKGRHGLLMFLH